MFFIVKYIIKSNIIY